MPCDAEAGGRHHSHGHAVARAPVAELSSFAAQPDALSHEQACENAAALVVSRAVERPHAVALVVPTRWDTTRVQTVDVATYVALADRVAQLQAGMARAGIGPGARVLVLFPLGIDVVATILALASLGAVAVLVDPGMSFARIRASIATARPDAVISIRPLLRLRPLVPELRRIPLAFCMDAERSGLGGSRPFSDLIDGNAWAASLRVAAVHRDDPAFVNFTSGSTGRPKGVVKTHGVVRGMHDALCSLFGDGPGDVAMPAFATFALHHLAAGSTCVFPPVDPRRPQSASGATVVRFAAQWGVTHLVLPPFLLRQVVDHVRDTGEPIVTLRRCFTGGAPVPAALVHDTLTALPDVAAAVVYGSAEAEPIASAPFTDVACDSGPGVLVGTPVAAANVAVVDLGRSPPVVDLRVSRPVIDLRGSPPAVDVDAARVADGEVGEIVVSGPHVVGPYLGDPDATRAGTLHDSSGRAWHRTGDTGYLDAGGALHLTGRLRDVVHRAGDAIQPLVVEAALDRVSGVARAALVAHRAAPCGEVLVEPAPGVATTVPDAVRRALVELGLEDLPVEAVRRIPLDGRHHSKIDRPTLRDRREAAAIAHQYHVPRTAVGHLPGAWRDALARDSGR